jgi:glyoxylase-like metal-dependent hydrolase (beta-lactamase superfamily II)
MDKRVLKMGPFIISFILFVMLPFTLLGQNIKITKISDDIIVLHPAEPRNLSVIREVGGTMVAIHTTGGIVVFDSFTSLQAGTEARNLIEKYFPNVPIKYLINTHHHADHVRGNQCFRDACIIGHRNVERYMLEDHERLMNKYGHFDSKIDSLSNLLSKKNYSSDSERKNIEENLALWRGAKAFLEPYVPTPPSFQISSNTILKFGGKTFEILFFGIAHTDNDLVVLDKEDRLLIMGDLFCYRKCYIMGLQSDAENWISLLDQLIDRKDEYDYVIPGHGGVVENVDALIEQRDYLKNICEVVVNARQKGLTLGKAKESICFEQYNEYIMYDRIGLDVEAYWQQLEKRRN